MFRSRCVGLCALFAYSAAALLGQSERGVIAGAVLDTTGAVVPGAKVTLTNVATNVTLNSQTNEVGAFTFPSLPVGEYNLRVEKEGFKPALRTGITVNAASSVRLDITLEVGAAAQAVEIRADAIVLQTDSAKSSTTITNKLVDELPLVVGGALRSVFDLANLVPESKNFGDNNFMIGGGQAASYGTTLDGISANTTRALQQSWVSVNAPSLEAVTEFTVDTNGFKAEYGHAAGGVISFVSKSGTNEFHGSVYEFLRNDALDARRFFEAKKGVYKQHDFGFSAGGPVWLPKLYNGKNRTFFFTAYEGFRNRLGANTRTVTVPTEEMYRGDFSNWVDAAGNRIPIFDPFSLREVNGQLVRDPFTGNQIPVSRFDPFSVQALKVYQTSGILKPNNGAQPGTLAYVRQNYLITQGTIVAPQNKFNVKIDHIFNENNRISGYLGIARTYEKPGPNGEDRLPGLYSDYNDTRRHSDVIRFSWDKTISPTLINRFYGGGNNWRENHDPPQAYIGKWKDKLCLKNVPNCDENLMNLRFDGYQGWGGPANNGSENFIIAFNDDLTWIKGKHTIKTGVMHQRSHYNGFGRQDIAGRADFSWRGTNIPNNNNELQGGNAFASFLLGWANGGAIDTVRYISQQWPHWAGYIQDDWRITQRLTLMYGLRWETQLPPVEGNDRWSDFSPTRPNPAADNIPGALIFAGKGPGREGTRSLADSYYKAFGPRIGFAYSLNDKTVIRMNYARSFGAITTVTGSTHQRGFTLTYNPPSPTNNLQPSFLLKDGFPAWTPPPFIDPSFANRDSMPWWQGREATRPPENNSWNLSIQRQLSPTLVVDVSYNAVIGSHLQANLLNYNQVPFRFLEQYGAQLLSRRIDSPEAIAAGFRPPFRNFVQLWGNAATVAQALRPYPQYQFIDTWSGGGDHSGHSSYHAGIIKLDKRYGSGLTFTTSYVFSKIITDADSYWSTDFDRSADHYNRRLEKSIGAFDVTHNFKLGLVYELPFGKGRRWLNKGLTATLLGGWRVSSIHFYSSGRPVRITTNNGTGLIFAGRQVPFVRTYEGWRGPQAGSQFDPQTDRFFQSGNVRGGFFEQPAGLLVGNMTRFNPKLREFPNLTENVSVAKTFQMAEKLRLDFRAEAFNVANRVRFGTGSNNINDPNFGRLTGNNHLLNEPRRLQFALKLYW